MEHEIEIDVASVRELVDSDEQVILIDCREPSEHDICQIEGAKLIPMRETNNRLTELEAFKDQRVVVY